ncbi:S-adenosylmethionine sensor upstream of mTORC1 [Prorops nasuta]|uniref:S-adenosylmethionine sensor upstream of mTORC1 n=1 Tax=Prorops nasuta TaxID=863751 RepID=UPI0034CE6B65
MACIEQKNLADFIKQTHSLLRNECRAYGASKAWQKHLTCSDLLQEYSLAMQKLAKLYWTKENDLDAKLNCRLEWIKRQCEDYFFNKLEIKCIEKDIRTLKKTNCQQIMDNSVASDIFESIDFYGLQQLVNLKKKRVIKKIDFLDVGSCYNPFFNETMFNVTAIDLISITGLVSKCDFLNVKIGEQYLLSADNSEILQLQKNSYDVINFCLFLEYLPCPRQRFLCCTKAYQLLRENGLLFIISPDSKHIGANAKLLKSWKYTLSRLGFMRVKYEKLRHLHCMVFRKCMFKSIALKREDPQKITSDNCYYSEGYFFIPQDFQVSTSNEEKINFDNYDTESLKLIFTELPFNDC